jgi:hypothetical protein
MQVSRIEKVDADVTGLATPSRSFESLTSSSSASTAQAETSLAHVHGSPNSSRVSPLTASYSTTVAGKNYPLSVEESGGFYVASVPNPPGASATGSSPQSAEDNLNFKLDTLA